MFEGEYLNNEENGKGKEYYYDGELRFEDEFKNGLRWNGKGYDAHNNIIYELKNGKGYVIEYFREKLDFESEYLNGQKNWKGKEHDWKGNLNFEGEYLNNKRIGEGREYDKNGEIEFEGEYLYGYKLRGKHYVKGKLEFDGEYLFDKKWNGKGYDKNGNVLYELSNGNGKVEEYKEAIKVFEGEYANGKKNGIGKEYDSYKGKLIYEGQYLNGRKCEMGKNIMRMVI